VPLFFPTLHAALAPEPLLVLLAVGHGVPFEGGDQQELLTQAIDSVPAGTAEAAVKDARVPLTPQTLDRIWITIVRTFSWVLGGATVGLVAIVLLDIFYPVELAHVQIMLTMFTTVAGAKVSEDSGRRKIGDQQERCAQADAARTPASARRHYSGPLLALFTQVPRR
jgi:hypothetical protein